MPSIANISVSARTMVNILPGQDARLGYIVNQVTAAAAVVSASASVATSSSASPSTPLPTFSPPRIESLVASSAEQDLASFGDVTFDIFDDDDDLFGSPMAFDASEQGLWNGRFVPPPPRPPFFVDEPVLSDGLTTCDLCSWAMPTKSTFMFEGTIEKASELGWPLTLIIVSVLSALFGAIIMIAVVRCRRKKSSNNRNDTHVQWWSRNKRAHGNGAGGTGGSGSGAPIAGSGSAHNNNNHLRRSNIYTAHPADSIRGLQPLPLPLPLPMPMPLPMPPTLPATSSTSMLSVSPAAAAATVGQQQQHQQQQQPAHYFHSYHHHHHHHAPPPLPSMSLPHYPHDCDEDAAYEEPEYHQPQQLHSSSTNSNSNSNSDSMSSVTSSPAPTETNHWPQAGTMVVAS
ncbi:dual specificity tyrosine-phosphorylation-regulated kinase 1A [Drosophila sulfurigaster albostrigata]|uniref:dual specificity tyrosine-phosphorylation-regulated kinase 1A n=1 Tax=Drosophila sulfurigaster albostrigata TaxID=89887 RepID=UPI002D2183C3|nr:dual specificity tyrosine-phosphorylation-regulated kinase 1A [Drosophila sulfurigaster albostrigata]